MELNYKLVSKYLRENGKRHHMIAIGEIVRDYEEPERYQRYKEYIDKLISSGEIDPKEIHQTEEEKA